ncbi:hypothetical protein HY041_02615, partial [Candidatus Roizmanbacteria bacterium]|nr:hypothetical protein [Candidatus Roizmanbacteria bacterium]
MNIHKLVEKAIVLVSSMSLLLQSFSPFAFFIPTKINAQESLKAEVDFNTSNNTFIVKVNNKDANTTGSVDYALTYRTDTQNEAIKGTSDKELKDNFQKDFYAGTCSSNGT